MHRHAVAGLQEGWDYYPALIEVMAADLHLLGRKGISKDDIERRLHDLVDSDGVITDALKLGNHYNAVSHTDLVHRVLTHLTDNEDAIPSYPLVAVDEYQDFSLLETSFLRLLAEKSKVMVAGDDDQALYAFKNASSRYIRELHGDDVHENFDLPYCSRCPQVIVDAVNDVIAAARANGNLCPTPRPAHCRLGSLAPLAVDAERVVGRRRAAGGRVQEDERARPLGVGGRVHDREAASDPCSEERGTLRASLLEDRGDVVHPLLDRGFLVLGQRVGESDPSHVQHQHTAKLDSCIGNRASLGSSHCISRLFIHSGRKTRSSGSSPMTW
jgi:hypothetical protein